jgi:hypothetical protein
MKSVAITVLGLATLTSANIVNVGMSLDSTLPADEMRMNFMNNLKVDKSETNFIQDTGIKYDCVAEEKSLELTLQNIIASVSAAKAAKKKECNGFTTKYLQDVQELNNDKTRDNALAALGTYVPVNADPSYVTPATKKTNFEAAAVLSLKKIVTEHDVLIDEKKNVVDAADLVTNAHQNEVNRLKAQYDIVVSTANTKKAQFAADAVNLTKKLNNDAASVLKADETALEETMANEREKYAARIKGANGVFTNSMDLIKADEDELNKVKGLLNELGQCQAAEASDGVDSSVDPASDSGSGSGSAVATFIEVGEKVHAKCAHLHNKMMGLVELASFKRGESTFSSGSIGDWENGIEMLRSTAKKARTDTIKKIDAVETAMLNTLKTAHADSVAEKKEALDAAIAGTNTEASRLIEIVDDATIASEKNLVTDPNTKLNTLKKAHGVATVDWNTAKGTKVKMVEEYEKRQTTALALFQIQYAEFVQEDKNLISSLHGIAIQGLELTHNSDQGECQTEQTEMDRELAVVRDINAKIATLKLVNPSTTPEPAATGATGSVGPELVD